MLKSSDVLPIEPRCSQKKLILCSIFYIIPQKYLNLWFFIHTLFEGSIFFRLVYFFCSKKNQDTMRNSVIALMIVSVFFSCSRNEKQDIADKAQDAQELVEEKTDSTVEGLKDEAKDVSNNIESEKDALVSKIDYSKEQINIKLKQADEDIKHASAQEKVRLEKKKNDLKNSLDELDKSLEELKSEKKRDWKEFKKDLNKQIDKVQEKIQ